MRSGKEDATNARR